MPLCVLPGIWPGFQVSRSQGSEYTLPYTVILLLFCYYDYTVAISNLDGTTLRQDWSANVYDYTVLSSI